ncbi:MAG: hydrogenase maturation protease, partial [Phycisphaeraceae bacterium]|nr:hydrogenase maturation protease [Phycisphaeraceae bacterium]
MTELAPTVGTILIATCGNRDAGDDAFGPAVACMLRAGRLADPGVEVIDLDINPTELLNHVEGRAGLLVVDAVCAPGIPAGRLLDRAWDQILDFQLQHDDPLSSHGLSVAGQIVLAHRLGMLPLFVRLIGATIDRSQIGSPMSDAVRALVPEAAARIVH